MLHKSIATGASLHDDSRKRASRLSAWKAQIAATEAQLVHPLPKQRTVQIDVDSIVQRLYQRPLDQKKRKEEYAYLAEREKLTAYMEELHRLQSRIQPGAHQRLYRDHARRSAALEKRKLQQQAEEMDWLRQHSVHKRGGDYGVFSGCFAKSSARSSLVSTPTTTAPSSPASASPHPSPVNSPFNSLRSSPNATPGRRGSKESCRSRSMRAAALAEAAQRLTDLHEVQVVDSALAAATQPSKASKAELASQVAEEEAEAVDEVDAVEGLKAAEAVVPPAEPFVKEAARADEVIHTAQAGGEDQSVMGLVSVSARLATVEEAAGDDCIGAPGTTWKAGNVDSDSEIDGIQFQEPGQEPEGQHSDESEEGSEEAESQGGSESEESEEERW